MPKFRRMLRRFLLILCLPLILAACGPSDAPQDIPKMAKSVQALDRENAVYAMAKNYQPSYFALYVNLLIDADVSVRRAALRNVEHTKDPRFIRALKEMPGNIDPEENDLVEDAIKALTGLPPLPGTAPESQPKASATPSA